MNFAAHVTIFKDLLTRFLRSTKTPNRRVRRTWLRPGPRARNPTNGRLYPKGIERVFFLAGTSPLVQEEGDATRTCTVPADTALLFPVINAFCTDDERNYPQCARGPINRALATGETFATLDGEDLKIRRLATGPFTLILPEDNVFGLERGPYEHRAISDGLWVYLPQGLEPREDPYTLHFAGDLDDFSVNVTYELIVV